MREIKFRAWDKDVKKFADMCAVHIDGDIMASSQTFGGLYDFVSDDMADRIVLQQHTGLKDKNGVEIYEGDILAYETSQSTTKGVVEYGSGLYGWVHAGIWFHMWDMHLDSAEVIGNIYENPELLTPELSSKEKESKENE